MAFNIGKNKGFIHVPKTGGRCVENSLPYFGIRTHKITQAHDPVFWDGSKINPNSQTEGRTYFICVRKPDVWLASYHFQQSTKGKFGANKWKPLSEIDNLISDDYHKSIENIINSKGAIGRMFACYMQGVNVFVGHTESLDKDFSDFFGTKLTKLKNNYKSMATFPERYRDDIFESERLFMEKYYS